MPHIWCPGCGIAMRSHAHAVLNSGIKEQNQVVVSGIDCSGRAAGHEHWLVTYHSWSCDPICGRVEAIQSRAVRLGVTVWSGGDIDVEDDLIDLRGSPTIVSGLEQAETRARQQHILEGDPGSVAAQLAEILATFRARN